MDVLGNLRPSQLVYTFGVGALLDLPYMSALILGLDDWSAQQCEEIHEERLLAAVQARLGQQVKKLLHPPMSFDESSIADTAGGVPVAPFPRWLRCPLCDTLATIESGIFDLMRDRWRPDRTKYVHGNCSRQTKTPPAALSVRFLLACRDGHLTDFPWVAFVHKNNAPCKPCRLTMREYGAAGDASDIIIKCLECSSERRMADAFDDSQFRMACNGHHPHLRRFDSVRCQEPSRTILLGASNSWFPSVMSALSLPPRTQDRISLAVSDHWLDVKDIPSLEVARYVLAPTRMPALVEFSIEEVWEAIEAKRQIDPIPNVDKVDLKIAEWGVLNQQALPPATNDFRAKHVAPPSGFELKFQQTLLLERLREVRALAGFTRIESKGDFADASFVDDGRQTPLSRLSATWLPASEVRGEGLFLRLEEAEVQAWEQSQAVRQLEQEFFQAHRAWRRLRKQEPSEAGFPGIRFVLLHSLSHALMRQIAIECGYTSASLRERLYCRGLGENHGPMAGILIYTAASDSEGTLGGLVHLGQPVTLGRHVHHALEAIRICGSDPLCAEHPPIADGRSVHGACCHACLFAPETSCERGNRFLDRSVLTGTFASRAAEFFAGL